MGGYDKRMSSKYLRATQMLLTLTPVLSVVGCPVVPPASEWGAANVGCLDQWSLAHLESGMLLGEALGEDNLWPSMAALVGWEIVEPSVWHGEGETAQNQCCDVLVGGLGWSLATIGKR